MWFHINRPPFQFQRDHVLLGGSALILFERSDFRPVGREKWNLLLKTCKMSPQTSPNSLSFTHINSLRLVVIVGQSHCTTYRSSKWSVCVCVRSHVLYCVYLYCMYVYFTFCSHPHVLFICNKKFVFSMIFHGKHRFQKWNSSNIDQMPNDTVGGNRGSIQLYRYSILKRSIHITVISIDVTTVWI